MALPVELRSAYPYRSDGRFPLNSEDLILEPITTLSYLAAVTDSVHLGFSVLVLPYRHPVLNAKMLATLDVVSGGRLIVGAGVGWMAEEFAALDADFDARGGVTDEHIAILRALWSQPSPVISGPQYDVSGVSISPRPLQDPHPPIWDRRGQRAGPPPRGKPRRRLAWRPPVSCRRGWRHLRNLAVAFEVRLDYGGLRDFTEGRAGHYRSTFLRRWTDSVTRPAADQVSADLLDYANAGLTYLMLEPRAESPEQFLQQLERFAKISKGE